jgi:hypothetical protein
MHADILFYIFHMKILTLLSHNSQYHEERKTTTKTRLHLNKVTVKCYDNPSSYAGQLHQ